MPIRLSPRLVALLVIGGVIAATYFFGSPPTATIADKAKHDHVIQVAQGDPDMEDAFRKAKTSMPDFLKIARAPPPSVDGIAVKVPISDGGANEFFWISQLVEKDGRFQGRIANKPRSVHTVRQGQTITFQESEIVDWTYRQNNRMFGNFTMCAILKNEPEQADKLRKEYGLVCG